MSLNVADGVLVPTQDSQAEWNPRVIQEKGEVKVRGVAIGMSKVAKGVYMRSLGSHKGCKTPSLPHYTHRIAKSIH